MNEETLVAFGFMVSSAFLLGMWLRAEMQRHRAEKRLWAILGESAIGPRTGAHAAAPVTGARRVDQIEAQLDQMVQQIDRLAESQEFLSRVLTDRIDQFPDPRLRTPH